MKKKAVLVALILLVAGVTNIFAFGIGVQGGFNAGGRHGGTGGLAVTFGFGNNWLFAADAALRTGDPGYFRVGLTADKWFFNNTIVGPLGWFVGVGLYGSVVISDSVGGAVGVRVPIGLNAFFLGHFLEPYLQIAPSFGLEIYKGFGFDWFIPINLGIRFWIGKNNSSGKKK